jgi:acetone carboxylase gamma subunit
MKLSQHFIWPLLPSNLPAPLVLLLLTSSPLVQHHTAVSAQEHGYYTPIVTTGAAFARTQTKLYVLSGNAQNVGNSAIPQFISLDLNVNWNTTAPAWTKLADGPMQDIFPAAFTSDEQSMFVFHLKVKGLPWQYHVESDSWYVGGKDSFTDMDMQGVNVVTDPRSSLMYVPEGYDLALLNQKPWNLTTMAIFDPLTSSLNHMTLPVPDEVFPVRQYYGNVWSKKRNSILYFGGHNLYVSAPVPKYPNIVTEFSPDTMTFRALVSFLLLMLFLFLGENECHFFSSSIAVMSDK